MVYWLILTGFHNLRYLRQSKMAAVGQMSCSWMGRTLVATRANPGVVAAWVYHMMRVRQVERLRGGVWTEVHVTALRREQKTVQDT